jgi:hypothetical protein
MPIAEKLVLPQGYGQTTQTLAWKRVRVVVVQGAVRVSKPSPELAQRLAG